MEKEIDFKTKFMQNKLNYFYIFFNSKSANQHMNLLTEFESFINGNKEYEDKFEKIIAQIVKTPVDFFIKQNPDYFTKDELRTIDREFKLPSLDYLYYRDTAFSNQLKVSYDVAYKKISRKHSTLTFHQLLDVMAFIRRYLKKNIDQIAKDLEIVPTIILPEVEKHEKSSVGIQ